MKSSGANTFKGLNTQARAALSLFFQFLSKNDFSYIHLEAPNFQDFNLVFNNGKKIICESKDWKEPFNYSDLAKILNKVAAKQQVNTEDEILIICTNVNEDLVRKVDNSRYWDHENSFFAKKGYTNEAIALLPIVRFWHIKVAFTHKFLYSQFAGLLNFWLPERDIKGLVNTVLVENIQIGSEKSHKYFRSDFIKEISTYREESKSNSVYYRKREKAEARLQNVEAAVNDYKHDTWVIDKEKLALTIDWPLFSLVMNRFKDLKNLNLKKWNSLWQVNNALYLVFHIFNNNLQQINKYADQNRKYIIEYSKKCLEKTVEYYYRFDFILNDIVNTLSKILDEQDSSKYLEDIYQTIEKLLNRSDMEFFYLGKESSNFDNFQRGQACKVLHNIYKRAENSLQERIINLIFSTFNLIKDEGKAGVFESNEAYPIVFDWLNEDFVARFPIFLKGITGQYDLYYKKLHKSVCFKGWELSGGVGMYFDGDYHLVDRHFVVNALMPAIQNFYKADSAQAWEFIKNHCIVKEKDVSENRPDFLNRSVYNIVLDRCASSDTSIAEEAFNILREFILSKQGIPHKADLIYQELPKSSCDNLSNEKKWRLVSLKLNDKDSIVTIFIARVVSHLAQQGYTQAKDELLKWIEQPNFYEKGFGFDQNFILISNIESQLNSDLDYTISLFNALIKSEYVNLDRNDFSPYQAAFILRDILRKDYQKGLTILLELESIKALSKNLQILYTASLFNTRGTNEAEDEKLLFKIYEDTVDPLLTTLADDNGKVLARFSAPEARELFVQFATRLAAKKKITEALRIIRIFMNDPNPEVQSENIINGREPSTISSVRGWCGWALMHCAIVDGREHLSEIIKLAQKLLRDPNYYVIHVACFAYAQIAKNRLSVLPEKRDTLFFNDDHEKALKMAKAVEAMAFDLLNRFKDWPGLVQKGMATSLLKAFDAVRSLSENEVLILMETISCLSNEIVKQFLPLFLYYAEFREAGYAYWSLGLPGLFDDLGDYKSEKPRKKLREIIERLEKDDPSNCVSFAWAISNMVEADFGKDRGKKTESIAIHYFELLSNNYNHAVYSNIYHLVIKKFSNFSDYNLEPWFGLLKKCLERERLNCSQESGVYLNQIEILALVFEKMDTSAFIEIAEIVFTYPKNIILHNLNKLVPIMRELGQIGKRAEALKLAELLLDKYPEVSISMQK